MNTEHTPATAPLIEDMVREYALLQDERAQHDARIKEIAKTLRGSLPVGFSATVAGLRVTIARNARMDADAFMTEYPVTANPDLYKAAPDAAAIKRKLAPETIEALQVEGEARVTIK